MQIRNIGNSFAEIDIDGYRFSISPGSYYTYNPSNNYVGGNFPSNSDKGLLETVKNSLLYQVRSKIQEFKLHEGLAPKEMEEQMKKEVDAIYKKIKSVEALITSF